MIAELKNISNQVPIYTRRVSIAVDKSVISWNRNTLEAREKFAFGCLAYTTIININISIDEIEEEIKFLIDTENESYELTIYEGLTYQQEIELSNDKIDNSVEIQRFIFAKLTVKW